ncbi:MAG: retropepsin-like aspartic protease [Bacteroidales bacterium]
MLINCQFGCNRNNQRQIDKKISALLEDVYVQENYFKLKQLFEKHQEELSRVEKLYFSALINNAFYDHKTSNADIDRLLRRYVRKLNETKLMHLHKAKFMNHYNLYEYKNALASCSLLIADYKHIMDSAAYVNLFNDEKILSALRSSPRQEIIKNGDSWIEMRRDKMGLLNISMTIDTDSIDFLFDTGSSFSFIKRSIAENAGLSIFDVNFEVEGATGAVVVCDIALMPKFSIGNLEVKNAVFWVFDDKDVTLPEYDYSVNGAIAFPIIKSMEEVHIIFEDSIFVPRVPEEYKFENLAINDLDPVLAVIVNGDTLPYYFDTGSAFSSLYKPYYDKFSEEIDSTYEQFSFNIGSLGGVREFTCYIIDSLQMEVAGSSAVVHDIETHTEFIYKDPEKVYGNLGQDFVLQFGRMVISTKCASVFLSNH